MTAEGQNKIAQMVTDEILEALDRGVVPWRSGWTAKGWLPTSMSTGKPYRGSNPWVLNIRAQVRGYKSPYWGTYDRIAELSGMVRQGKRWVSPDGVPRGVRAGEKSTIVVFNKRIVKADDTADDGKRVFYMLRFYRVFNADQADGLPERFCPEPDERTEEERDAAFDAIVEQYLANDGPKWEETPFLDAPHYTPMTDTVTMPLSEQFETMLDRYSTTAHELTHSTGHPHRLDRFDTGMTGFDHEERSQEELVAALGSSMLLAFAGLDANIESNAAYVKAWRKALGDDPQLIIKAAGKAWNAVDHICGVTYDNDPE